MTQIIGRLESNIKGANIDDHLSKLHIWQGLNGAGKTARQDAITIAINGSRGKGRGTIDDLTPPNASHVYSILQLSGGVYRYNGTLDTPHIVQAPENGKAPLIVRPAAWLTTLGPKRVREEIVARWGSGFETIETASGATRSILSPPPELSQEQAALWSAGVAAVKAEVDKYNEGKKPEEQLSSDPTYVLAELQSWARKEKLAKGRARDSISEAIELAEKQIAEQDTTASPEDLPRLQEMLKAAEEAERNAATVAHVSAEVERLTAKLTKEVAEFNDHFARYQALTPPNRELRTGLVEKVDMARNACATLEGLVNDLFPKMHLLIDNNPAVCPICTAAYSPQTSKQMITEQSKAVVEQLRIFSAQRKIEEDALAAFDKSVKEYDDYRAWLEAQHAKLTNDNATIQKLRETIPVEYKGESAPEIRKKISSATTLKNQREMLQKQRLSHSQMESAVAVAKQVEVAAGQLLQRLIVSITDRVRSATIVHLPDHLKDRFVFDLDGFSMIGADGRPHSRNEQCGAEYAALMLALAKAWASDTPFVLLLDYRNDLADFDSFGALASVMNTIEKTALSDPNCIMVAITTPTPLPVSPNWTVQNVGNQSRNVTAPVPAVPPELSSTPRLLPAPLPVALSPMGTIETPVAGEPIPVGQPLPSMKHETDPEPSPEVEETEAPVAPKKKGRGRPKKAPVGRKA